MNGSRFRLRHVGQIAFPCAIAGLTLTGLIVALVGDGIWDAAGDGLIILGLALAGGGAVLNR